MSNAVTRQQLDAHTPQVTVVGVTTVVGQLNFSFVNSDVTVGPVWGVDSTGAPHFDPTGSIHRGDLAYIWVNDAGELVLSHPIVIVDD